MADLILSNLKLLKEDMKKNGFNTEYFYFNYNKHRYLVFVDLYNDEDYKPEYGLVMLTFCKDEELSNRLMLHANSYGLIMENDTEKREFRIFFEINPNDNASYLLYQFANYLKEFIPLNVTPRNINENRLISRYLDTKTGKDPNAIYCKSIIRHFKDEITGEQRKRTPENTEKTKRLRPSLLERFKNDRTVSFGYSPNLEEEKTDAEILRNYYSKNHK